MITLTTDFGDSAYVGAMKGAIYRVNPSARVVDVTHAVPAHDVTAGALALYAAAPCFPAGSVHVAVVDPGVGTSRRALAIETREGILLGPDNGLLVPAARKMGLVGVREITNRAWFRDSVSATFHGRDVFASTAARLDAGADLAEVGPELADFVDLTFDLAPPKDGVIEARILAIDPFGTAVTNVPGDLVRVGDEITIKLAQHAPRLPVARTFADAHAGEALLIRGSAGFLEIAVNRGSAAQRFELAAGQSITLRVP